MNELTTRQELKLKFILPSDIKKFEHRVIDVYCKKEKQEPPNIWDNLFLYIMLDKPEQFVAAFLAEQHLNPRYFFDATVGMSERQKYLYVRSIREKYELSTNQFCDQLLYEDIKSVLDYHSMVYEDSNKTYRNLPTVEVW